MHLKILDIQYTLVHLYFDNQSSESTGTFNTVVVYILVVYCIYTINGYRTSSSFRDDKTARSRIRSSNVSSSSNVLWVFNNHAAL